MSCQTLQNRKQEKTWSHKQTLQGEDGTGDIVPLLFSDSDVSDAFIRASKNKEDIPEYRLKNIKECVDVYVAGMLCVLGFVSGIASCWVMLQTFN